jgi:hypothetical protein
MRLYEVQQPRDRSELAKIIGPFLSYLTKDNLQPKYVARKLKSLTASLGVVKVSAEYTNNVEVNDMNLNATYDPWDDKKAFVQLIENKSI